jgi:hypothetical protein
MIVQGGFGGQPKFSNGTEARAMRNANGLRSVLVVLALTASLAACSAMSGRETTGEMRR